MPPICKLTLFLFQVPSPVGNTRFAQARFSSAILDEKWDALYQEYLPLAAEAEQPRQYYEILLRFINTLNDGHSYILVPDEIRPPYSALFFTSYVDGKHILTGVPKESSGHLGAEILAVNGTSIEDYLEKYVYPRRHKRNADHLPGFASRRWFLRDLHDEKPER